MHNLNKRLLLEHLELTSANPCVTHLRGAEPIMLQTLACLMTQKAAREGLAIVHNLNERVLLEHMELTTANPCVANLLGALFS